MAPKVAPALRASRAGWHGFFGKPFDHAALRRQRELASELAHKLGDEALPNNQARARRSAARARRHPLQAGP